MKRLNPKGEFLSELEKKIDKGKIIIVHHAIGGKSIRNWDKSWKGPDISFKIKKTGKIDEFKAGRYYEELIDKTKKSIEGKKISTVTFLWMQGEKDAKAKWAVYYKNSFLTILEQLKSDLNIKKINFVIGRLSDFGLEKSKNFDNWEEIRKIQEDLANEYENGELVNCDDLNDNVKNKKKGIIEKNALHYSEQGYKLLGKRFAQKAIMLLNI